MSTNLKMRLNHSICDERGHVAVMLGLVIMPVVMLGGGAIDYGRAFKTKQVLQAAADAAVLAAVAMPTGSTAQARETLATSIFNANLNGVTGVTPAVTVNGNTVSLIAQSSVPTAFLKIAHIDTLNVSGSASGSASYTTPAGGGGKICLLALDPNSDDGIHVQGTNDVNYPGCWAQTNSSKTTAINGVGNAMVTGAGHCAVGGVGSSTGHFTPAAQGNCAVVNDPFATVGAYASPAAYQSTFTAPSIPSTCKASNLNLKKGTFTLDPGRYCGGINLQAHATVTFNPGIYIIDNGLFNVQSGASANGSNLLLYFSGANARMTVIGGGTISMKGRQTGNSYEGFLFIAHPDAWRGLELNIQGGGTFNLEGMLYMPTQRIEVSGNGNVNGSTQYFGMVAKDFYFRGNGTYNLKVRDSASLLPDIMPSRPGTAVLDTVKLN